MTPLDAALEYIAKGWNPVPVRHKDKAPIGEVWQLRVIDAGSAPKFFNGRQMNIGVILGSTSHGLTDVDLDCAEAVAIAPYILPSTKALFGRSGKRMSHWLFYSDLCASADTATIAYDDPNKRGKAKGRLVELRIGSEGHGAQTVFPPSTHESGQVISWEEAGEPARVDGSDLRRRVAELAACCLLARYWPNEGSGHHDAARVTGGFLARAGKAPGAIRILVEAIGKAACSARWRELARTAEDAAKAHTEGRRAFGLPALRDTFGKEVANQIADWLGYRGARDDPEPNPQPPEKGKYMEGKSALASNVGNTLLALETEPELVGAFGYDEMLRTEVLLRPLFKPADPNFRPRPVTDADVCAVQAHLQWFGFRRVSKDATHDAINKHAREHAFHPVRDYLDTLRWDGKGRLKTFLHDYFGAPQTKYTEQVGTMFLIGMVARIYKPGCKLDHMLILEGPQGTLKSSACGVLAGAYFSDQLPDITSKEAFLHMRGKWLIEVAELRAYSRAAVDHFKEFLTRRSEQYRPPYARKEVNEPRTCCFIGTTNKSLYLRDETGNRRFWPVPTGDINLDRLRADRDQLFAEAVNLFRAGMPWWPDGRQQACIADEQEARFEPDAWEVPIKRFLDVLHEKKTTIFQVALGALDYEGQRPRMPKDKDEPQPVRGTPINRLSPKDQQRIAAVLVHLGWEPKRDANGRWWEPKADTGLTPGLTPQKPAK
jgi:hypothetical protein